MSHFNLTSVNISILIVLSLQRGLKTNGFSSSPAFRIHRVNTATYPAITASKETMRAGRASYASNKLYSSFLEEPSTSLKEEKDLSNARNEAHQTKEFPFDVEILDPSQANVQLRADKIGPNNEVSIQKSSSAPSINDEQKTNDDNKLLEFVGLGTWIAGLSTFLLVNNYVGPWPGEWLHNTPVKYFGLTHALSGMLFGGGIILTTFIEWLAVSSKNSSVLNFWFGKVPALDSLVVLPALTASIVSGVGLSVDHYNSLGEAPIHVVSAISTLLAFAIWWATTDLTTQGAASEAIEEWTKSGGKTEVPRIVQLRKISNVVSCVFVAAIYAIMVLKPGYTPS